MHRGARRRRLSLRKLGHADDIWEPRPLSAPALIASTVIGTPTTATALTVASTTPSSPRCAERSPEHREAPSAESNVRLLVRKDSGNLAGEMR